VSDKKYPFLAKMTASLEKFDKSPFDLEEMSYDLEMLVEYELGRAGRQFIQPGEGQRLIGGEA